MSHDHRDDHQLVDLDVVDVEPVVPVVPAPVVTNNEAERRAKARRQAEGSSEQTTEHQFTGDLPEPDRGGTDTETRVVFSDDDAGNDEMLANPAGAARRGPPPPRAQQLADETSWAAPASLDALGGSTPSDSASWLAPTDSRTSALGGRNVESWTTSDR
jgi:hypothetical protein